METKSPASNTCLAWVVSSALLREVKRDNKKTAAGRAHGDKSLLCFLLCLSTKEAWEEGSEKAHSVQSFLTSDLYALVSAPSETGSRYHTSASLSLLTMTLWPWPQALWGHWCICRSSERRCEPEGSSPSMAICVWQKWNPSSFSPWHFGPWAGRSFCLMKILFFPGVS